VQLEHQIANFLNQPSDINDKLFAVVGASTDRNKYGNKVLRVFQQNNFNVVPVNPNATTVEGLAAIASISDLPKPPHAISIITPPRVTENVVEEAILLGVQHIWMQPGVDSQIAVSQCKDAGINLIYGGPCILVVLGFRDR
jgi:uncharacterized protein